MSVFRLILRNLLYFLGVNLAVVAGVAVATAVLSGALMVGDSVRGSLTELAVQRLGKIDLALTGSRYFDATLAGRLSADPAIKGKLDIAPALIVRGGAAIDSSGAKTAGVQIIGMGGDWVPITRGTTTINSQAAEALGLESPGNDVVLSVPVESDIPREATLAHRSRQDALSGLRARVEKIVSEPGMISLFTPTGGQRSPQNAWVNLADLQDAIGRRGQVNALFVHEIARGQDAQQLNQLLRRVMTLADYGMDLTIHGNEAILTSRTTYLAPPIEQAAEQSGVPFHRVGINLINAVNRLSESGGVASSIHYAVAAGISPLDGTGLADDQIALNQWAAERLGAKIDDRLELKFYHRQFDGELVEEKAQFTVARILPMTGIGVDPTLTPTYKGLTDADTISSWNPPAEVKIDKSLVTPADEAYWKQYKAAPKLFINFASARRLWGMPMGDLASLRLPADRADEFSRKLLEQLDPATMGMVFRPLRQEQIAAASGTTDFGQLFIGFSFFLIIAAALLVAMLLRLSVEQRARQLGALSAVGFDGSTLRKIMLVEGLILSIAGGVIGTFAGIGYTWLMMLGLRTWWIGAVGTTAMRLHIVPLTLVIGFICAQFIAILAILWAVKQVRHIAPARLLAGGWETAKPVKSGSRWKHRVVGILGACVALILILSGALAFIPQAIAFFAGGFLLLASSLLLLIGMLEPNRERTIMESATRLGIRNSTRHPARSVLCIGLIALASFALVAVAAMRQGEPGNTADPRSGAGGYQLVINSEIPLLGNPSTQQGRDLLGFKQPSNPVWSRVEFLSMRRRDGQDVSCFNITQITNPTILGVPQTLIDRGGFTRAGNPWKLLEQSDPSGSIPIIADDSTANYILHIGIGQTLDIIDGLGNPRRLRLVATIDGSIFQSELLMSDVNFRSLFPSVSGFSTVLVRVKPEDQEQVRRMLSDDLNEYAASVRTTASVLGGYLQIQNTYLSTFELLGALGLMLGTIGLAVVLIRTIIERKAELALLSSLGFSNGSRIRLVLVENAFLLVTGLVLGTLCAIIAVLPALRESAREINFTSLALTLTGALLIGLLASVAAIKLGGAHVRPADLRKE